MSIESLRRQVEQIEEANRKAGYPVPEGALICLPYPEARALLDALPEIDRNARAYGWEVRNGHPLTEKIESTSPDNPFMDSDWRAHIPPPEQCSGAIPSMSPPLERCTLVEGHDGPCQ